MIRTKLRKSDTPNPLTPEEFRFELQRYKQNQFFKVDRTLMSRFGLVTASVLSNLINLQLHFFESEKCPDGWFFQTMQQQSELFGLSEYLIRNVKKELMDLGILETEMRGIPPKEWYFINHLRLRKIILEHLRNIRLNLKGISLKNLEEYNNKNNINENNINNNHCGFGKPQELSLNTSSQFGEKEESPIHQKRPPLSARQGGKTKRKLSPLQLQQYSLVVNQFRKFQHQCLKIKSTTKDREAWMYGPIHKMTHGQGISPERIISAINWYIQHHQDPYIPSIATPYDLLNKFSKLEAAMNRKPEPSKKGPGWAGDGDFSQFKVQTWIDNGDGTWTDSESGARYDKPSFKGNRI